MASTNVFNPRRRRLLRSHVPALENWITVSLFCLLGGIIAWVALQRTQYNPGDRDIAVELLRDPDPPRLYTPPLKTWTTAGAAETPDAGDLGPFPAAILDSEWQPASRLKRFGADNLYEKINGEAEKFLKQGFQAMHYIVLKSADDGSEIAIELYDQGDMPGSMGIFSEHVSADKAIEQQGAVVFFRTAIGLVGRKGRFFFRVAGDRETETIQRKSNQLIDAFARLQDREGDIPEAFSILQTGLGIVPERISYQRHNVFQYDFARDFWFGRLAPEGAERVFIHAAPSADEAEQLYEQILMEQAYEYKSIDTGDNQVILRHEYLRNYFVIARQGRFVFGAENLADPSGIASIQARFQGQLQP